MSIHQICPKHSITLNEKEKRDLVMKQGKADLPTEACIDSTDSVSLLYRFLRKRPLEKVHSPQESRKAEGKTDAERPSNGGPGNINLDNQRAKNAA